MVEVVLRLKDVEEEEASRRPMFVEVKLLLQKSPRSRTVVAMREGRMELRAEQRKMVVEGRKANHLLLMAELSGAGFLLRLLLPCFPSFLLSPGNVKTYS